MSRPPVSRPPLPPGHYYGVRAVEFHPTAPIVASAAGASEVFLWDIEGRGKCGAVAAGKGDGRVDDDAWINNLCFNYDGSLLAAATRGCRSFVSAPPPLFFARHPPRWSFVRVSLLRLRGDWVGSAKVLDPRAGGAVGEAGASDTRAQRVVWCTNCGGSDALLTVGGAAGGRGRQLSLWDPRNLAAPSVSVRVDAQTGQLFPIYDEGTGTLLLSGRGDSTIRVYELGPR